MGDKIIRINMSNLTTAVETVPAEWAGLGGRATYLDYRCQRSSPAL